MQQIVEPLLRWYHANARILPWREDALPYRVWVSEVMLQQTRVEAVKPYFERFVEALPDIPALAACPEEILLKLWEGLGYYNRVRNLQKAAQILVAEQAGELPGTVEALKKLPGIGEYTAAAIASIAFGVAVPAVDGNVLRVLSRLQKSQADIRLEKVKQDFRQQLQAIEPEAQAGDFNQALMELGATLCLPNGAPHCQDCPLQDLCRARAQGKPEQYPLKTAKKPRRVEERTLILLLLCTPDHKQVLLHRRPAKGLLAGLWEFPGEEGKLTKVQATEYAQKLGLTALSCSQAGAAKHIFTHIEWQMNAWLIQAARDEAPKLPSEFVWADRAAMAQLTIPSAFKQYTQQIRTKYLAPETGFKNGGINT